MAVCAGKILVALVALVGIFRRFLCFSKKAIMGSYNQNTRQICCNDMEKSSVGFEPNHPLFGFQSAENGVPLGK